MRNQVPLSFFVCAIFVCVHKCALKYVQCSVGCQVEVEVLLGDLPTLFSLFFKMSYMCEIIKIKEKNQYERDRGCHENG